MTQKQITELRKYGMFYISPGTLISTNRSKCRWCHAKTQKQIWIGPNGLLGNWCRCCNKCEERVRIESGLYYMTGGTGPWAPTS